MKICLIIVATKITYTYIVRQCHIDEALKEENKEKEIS